MIPKFGQITRGPIAYGTVAVYVLILPLLCTYPLSTGGGIGGNGGCG